MKKVRQAQAGLEDVIETFENSCADAVRTGRLGKVLREKVKRALFDAVELLKESKEVVPKKQ